MLAVRTHIEECPSCRLEYLSLSDTKRLLASLAHRASRAEIEALLQCDSAPGGASSATGNSPFRGALRPRPLAATAILSLAGLWLASTAVDRGSPEMASESGQFNPVASATMNAGMVSTPFLSGFRGILGVPAPSAPVLSPATLVTSPGSVGVVGVNTSPMPGQPGSIVGVAVSSEMLPVSVNPAAPIPAGAISVREIRVGNGYLRIISAPQNARGSFYLPR